MDVAIPNADGAGQGRFVLANGWQPFPGDNMRLYLQRELEWELAENPRHALADKSLTAVAWIGGYDDLIVRLDPLDEFAYVHLTWNREHRSESPHCEKLGGVESVNDFMAAWRTPPDDEE